VLGLLQSATCSTPNHTHAGGEGQWVAGRGPAQLPGCLAGAHAGASHHHLLHVGAAGAVDHGRPVLRRAVCACVQHSLLLLVLLLQLLLLLLLLPAENKRTKLRPARACACACKRS